MNSPTSTNSPTRSSVQVSCLRCAMSSSSSSPRLPTQPRTQSALAFCSHSLSNSHQKPLQIRVLRLRQLLRFTLEIDPSFAIEHKSCGRLAVSPSCRYGAFRRAYNALGFRIKSEVRQRKSIL